MLHDLSRRLRRILNEGNVIRLPAVRSAADDRMSRDWRQRLLMEQGARMHVNSVERGDGCSIAILDTCGVVLAWHDTLPGAMARDPAVTGIHVSQFYLPHDVTFARPDRNLIAACLHGCDTQQRWHRTPRGSIFWAVTVIKALRLECGELNGYSHVTRYSQDPERARATPRQYPVCYGTMAVA